jgi:CRP-like cAMP-binding protein
VAIIRSLPEENRILAKLPRAERQRLENVLKPIDLPHRMMLYKAAAPIDYVYFPLCGVASAVAYVGDGAAIEVATVGNEGMLGVPSLFGPASSPNETYIQISGHGLRMPSAMLREHASPSSPLFAILTKYLTAYLYQISQAVACNGVHSVRQRCSRWLLMTHDRVHSDDLRLTHEFLGVMLGVRRASVSEVLQPFQERALIRSERGLITILDRKGLEAEACECYRLVADEYERLLG